jgi:hypothetical protein
MKKFLMITSFVASQQLFAVGSDEIKKYPPVPEGNTGNYNVVEVTGCGTAGKEDTQDKIKALELKIQEYANKKCPPVITSMNAKQQIDKVEFDRRAKEIQLLKRNLATREQEIAVLNNQIAALKYQPSLKVQEPQNQQPSQVAQQSVQQPVVAQPQASDYPSPVHKNMLLLHGGVGKDGLIQEQHADGSVGITAKDAPVFGASYLRTITGDWSLALSGFSNRTGLVGIGYGF